MGGNELGLFEGTEKWYTIDELAELSGLEKSTLTKGNSPLNSIGFGIDLKVESKTVNIGGHKNIKKYSENVLRTLKKYQLRNSTSNAVKNKEAVISGNISVIENGTVKQTIDNLLDNPDTLQMLLTESLARNKVLGIENKQLKDVIEKQQPKVEVYDSICESVTLQDLQTVATTIKLKNIFKVLEADKVLEVKYTDDGQKYYKPLSQYTNYLVLKDGKAWTDQNGIKHIRPRVFVTGKGLTWLTKKYSEESEF